MMTKRSGVDMVFSKKRLKIHGRRLDICVLETKSAGRQDIAEEWVTGAETNFQVSSESVRGEFMTPHKCWVGWVGQKIFESRLLMALLVTRNME